MSTKIVHASGDPIGVRKNFGFYASQERRSCAGDRRIASSRDSLVSLETQQNNLRTALGPVRQTDGQQRTVIHDEDDGDGVGWLRAG